MSTPASVLVADGTRDCADAVAMMLTWSGARATVAYDGREAISLARDEPFDVAVLDVTMPGISGYAVAGELRRLRGNSIKLIAYTAWPLSVTGDGHACDAFDTIVSKTCEPLELLRVISPENYASVLQSMQASGKQVRLELALANSLLDSALALAHRDQERHDRICAFVRKRVTLIQERLYKMAILEDREQLQAQLDALRERFHAQCR